MTYPEHEKLSAPLGYTVEKVSDLSQQLGDFYHWLMERYTLGVWDDEYYGGQMLMPTRANDRKLLAEYFDLDVDKLEAEKRQMLDEIRSAT
jgi:hypothetical protein